MCIALLLWLIKHSRSFLKRRAILNAGNLSRNSLLLVSLLVTGSPLVSQHQQLNYAVIHNGNAVGKILLQHTTQGSDVFIKVISNIRMRFIMSFQVNAEESSHYHEGKLVYSQVRRYVNGKSKINRSTTANGDVYLLNNDGKQSSFNHKLISCTVAMMYLREPVGMTEIYSDNFQQFIAIKRVKDHVYRLLLPDGNYNDYAYQNGICQSVEVHHSMYTVHIKLT